MTATETTEKQVISCDDCGKKYDVTRFPSGKRFRCKDCRAILTVPKPAEDRRGSYDARKKILFCQECARPLDVRKAQPGERVPCPRCEASVTVPEEHEAVTPRKVKETEPSLYDAEKKMLTCGACDAEYVVARYEPGREILCLGCESILVVPSDHVPGRRREKKRRRFKTKQVGLEFGDRLVTEQEGKKREERRGKETGRREKKTARREEKAEREAPKVEEEAQKAERKRKRTERREKKAERKTKTERRETKTERREKKPQEAPKTERKSKTERREKKKAEKEAPAEREAAEPREPRREKRKKKRRKKRKKKILLCCAHCEHKFDVTGVDSGRKIMCPECEELTEVPRLPVPDVHNQSAGELAVIDLDTDPPGGEASEEEAGLDIEATRNAFSAFYEEQDGLDEDEEDRDERGDTRATRLVPTIEIDEILEPRVKGRQDLTTAATRAAGITPRRSATRKPFPVFLVGGLALLLPCLALAAYLVIKSSHDIKSNKYAAKTSTVVQSSKPAEDPNPIRAGVIIEAAGVIRGGKGALLADKRCGFLLVTRGSGDLWVEDPTRGSKALFKELAVLHAQNRPITLKLVGTVRKISELEGLEGLPKVLSSHRFWVELDPSSIERIGYTRLTSMGNSVKPVKK